MAVSTRRQWRLILLFAMTLKMLLLVDINNKNILLHVTHVDISKHIIPWIRDGRPTIDSSGIGIQRYRRPPSKMLETPVIALGGGKDRPQRIAQGIEWNNVRVGDNGHGKVVRRGREETVIGKELTAGSSPPYQ
jgi:hypothetical protein